MSIRKTCFSQWLGRQRSHRCWKPSQSVLPFDLGPKLEELRHEAEDAISALSSENVSVTGEVRQVRITRLDVGPEHLRLVLTAEGRVRARVQAIP